MSEIKIGPEEMNSPRVDSRVSHRSKTSENEAYEDRESSVDEGSIYGSQNIYPENNFDNEVSVPITPKEASRKQKSATMNQTQAFPAKGFAAFRSSKKDDYVEVDATDPLLKPLLVDFSV